MTSDPIPFFVTDWEAVPEVEHPGEAGLSDGLSEHRSASPRGAVLFIVD